jgi:hypothetical protein
MDVCDDLKWSNSAFTQCVSVGIPALMVRCALEDEGKGDGKGDGKGEGKGDGNTNTNSVFNRLGESGEGNQRVQALYVLLRLSHEIGEHETISTIYR